MDDVPDFELSQAEGDDWSVPVGLITSLDDIHYPIEMSRSGFRDLDVRFV
jgi:hypothetical protein